MVTGRPGSLVAGCDAWVRCTHDDTAVDGLDGELTLTWTAHPPPEPEGGSCRGRGLATDRLCRIYRLGPGGVDRLAVGPTADGLDYARLPEAVRLVGQAAGRPGRRCEFAAEAPAARLDPVGIAIDQDDRLFLADAETRTVSVLDLWSRRLLRTVAVHGTPASSRAPVGLAGTGGGVVLVAVRGPSGLLRMSATRGPQEVDLPGAFAGLPAGSEVSRVAVLRDGTPVVLATEPGGDAWLLAGERDARLVGPASDIAVDREGAVVVAPCPADGGASLLRRFAPTVRGWTRAMPLDASGYDGGGIVVTRDGRVGYFSRAGFRLAVRGRVSYARTGACTTYRLDSGTPRNRWGRVLVEACVPDGTAVHVATATSDDDGDVPRPHEPAEPAACLPATGVSPPQAPVLVDSVPPEPTQPLHRRPSPVTPWWGGEAGADTWEAPVLAPPGRYLWVTLRLTGNVRRTPRVSEVRAERTSHGLLRRLPAVFSGEPAQADFLHRYLAGLEGFLHDLDLRARCREVLVDPHGTPAEALDWLGSFLGLVLDDRWAQNARRQLVAEIAGLYRRRGTIWALKRYLELFLAGDRAGDPAAATLSPVLLEHFRLRGVGGPLLGDDPALTNRSVVGAGFRVGGAVGEPGSRPLDPAVTGRSAFDSQAHRFTVLVPRPLGAEEAAAVRHVLETERPAHTVYELCTVDAGMRAGRGMHLGISSVVGPTGRLERAVSGRSPLGRGTVLGPPVGGVAVEAARVGTSARVG